MIVLMTLLYNFKEEDRKQEIESCIVENLENIFINKIVLFWENVSSEAKKSYKFFGNSKVVNIDISERPTYRIMFNYANAYFADNLIIVANSDILFDKQIQYLQGRNWHKVLWCVTRHNYSEGGQLELQGDGVCGSSDAWIFKAPIMDFKNDISLGILGCDSYLAQKASEAGLQLLNPCKWLVIRHRHSIGERNDSPNQQNYWQKSDYQGFCVQPTGPQL